MRKARLKIPEDRAVGYYHCISRVVHRQKLLGTAEKEKFVEIQPALLSPTSHYAVESRIANWHAEDGLPGERLDASEKLATLWKTAYGDSVLPGPEAARSP